MNPISMRFVAEFAELLTTALIHFVWQGAVLSLGLVLNVKLFAVRTARHRYLLSVGTLLLMSMAPFLTALLHRNVGSMPGTATDVTSEYSKTVVEDPSSVNVKSDPAAAISEAQINGSVDSLSQPVVSASWLNPKIEFYVLLAWLAGVLILSTRLTAGYCTTLWIRRKLTPLAEQFEQRVQSLGRKLGMDARNRIFTCMRIGQAVAVGFIRPIVLIPAAWLTQLTPELLEAVIAHELAHIRRWDLWVNLAQRVIETLLFYHPAVWWLSNRIRLEREMCCDEMAAECFDRVMYARSLELVAQFSNENLLLAASINGGKKMNLLRRVQYLLGAAPSDTAGNWWAIVFVGMVLTFAMAVAFSLTPGTPSSVVIADDTPDKSDESKVIEKIVVLPYQREKQIAEKIEAIGGSVHWDNVVPVHLPMFLHERSRLWNRIAAVQFDNNQVNDAGLKHLRGATNLNELDVAGNPITDAGLENLKAMKDLVSLLLCETQITDSGLEHLKGLTRLSRLWLSRTHITDHGLKHLEGLSSLDELWIDETQVTGAGLAHLKGLTNLRLLLLSDTQVTDNGLEHLIGLPKLESLALGQTQITDDGLEHIKKITRLKVLYLDNTQVTDNGLERLIEVATLEDLGLLETQITDGGLEHIKKMTNLKKLELSHTLTTPQGRAMLRKALPNCEIKSDP